jgi:hypothetical protein
MPIQELDELFARIATPEDKAQIEQILERNADAQEYMKSGVELYKAFVDGDRTTIDRLGERAAARPPERKTSSSSSSSPSSSSPTTSPVSTPAFDMTKVEELVNQRTNALLQQLLETDTFATKVTGLVKKTADELAPNIYATSSRNANEIYDIRHSHEKEFGQPLDITKFNEFLTPNQGKFATLTDSYNAFVNEDRIQVRIKQGVKEEREKERLAEMQTPGNTLGKSPATMADRFVMMNQTKMDNSRGDMLDQAAQALRRMQVQRVE